jgi:hypothetical protein
MTVIERGVAEGVHRVDDASVNWYASEDGEELTVVDAGLPHAHFDHVRFADRLRRARPRARRRRRPARTPPPVRARAPAPGRPTVVFTPGHTRGHCALHCRMQASSSPATAW